MEGSEIINLINRICNEEDSVNKNIAQIMLEQSLLCSHQSDVLWLCNDYLRSSEDFLTSEYGGIEIGSNFSISLGDKCELFTDPEKVLGYYLNRSTRTQQNAQNSVNGCRDSTSEEDKVCSFNSREDRDTGNSWENRRGRNMKRISGPSFNPPQPSNSKRSHDTNIDSDDASTMEVEDSKTVVNGGFTTAKNQYITDQQKKFGKSYNPKTDKNLRNGSLGGKRKFNIPGKATDEPGMDTISKSVFRGKSGDGGGDKDSGNGGSLAELGIDIEDLPDKLRSLDERFIVNILNEIIYNGKKVTWNDIAGLAYAKKCIMEAIIWPMQRPDLFTGLRTVPRGLLLFGPPGTGKTLLGKAIANMCNCTFFSISASSLTSKWLGEGEKMVRALFGVAEFKAPSVIFIDEIDSLLSMRGENDMEGTRRIKTEFLVQLDGITSANENGVILVIGATNRPQDLDEAARRRFVKRLYIPLPDEETRHSLLSILLKSNDNTISEEEVNILTERSDGYSCADIHNLCREAAMGPIRDISVNDSVVNMNIEHLRPISMKDFDYAFCQVRASVGTDDLEGYISWNNKYGSMGSAAPI